MAFPWLKLCACLLGDGQNGDRGPENVEYDGNGRTDSGRNIQKIKMYDKDNEMEILSVAGIMSQFCTSMT